MRVLAAAVAFVGVGLAFYLPGDFGERTPMRMAIALGALVVAVALELISTRRTVAD